MGGPTPKAQAAAQRAQELILQAIAPLKPHGRDVRLTHRTPEASTERPTYRGARTMAAFVASGVVLGGLAYSLLGHHGARGASYWQTPADIWISVRAAHYVADGALGHVYEGARTFLALPLFPIVLAPAAMASRRYSLTEVIPFVARPPTSWLVYAPYCLGLATAAIFAAERLGEGARNRRLSTWFPIATAALVVVPAGLLYGHYEDVLAFAGLLSALDGYRRGRYIRGALLLGVAVAFKTWAAVCIPFYVMAVPPGLRLRSALSALSLPAALAGFTLGVDWNHASRSLFQSIQDTHYGHVALWAKRDAVIRVGAPRLLYI